MIDLRRSSDPIAEARTLAFADARKEFDLAHAPLIRVRLLRTADHEHMLQFNIHHIISDGWSMDILVREIMQIYKAAVDRCVDPLPPLPIQYRDYVAWQASRLALQYGALRDYWRSQLGEFPPPVDLPADFPRPPLRSGRGSHAHMRLSRRCTHP